MEEAARLNLFLNPSACNRKGFYLFISGKIKVILSIVVSRLPKIYSNLQILSAFAQLLLGFLPLLPIIKRRKVADFNNFLAFSRLFLAVLAKNGIEKCTTTIIEKCTTRPHLLRKVPLLSCSLSLLLV